MFCVFWEEGIKLKHSPAPKCDMQLEVLPPLNHIFLALAPANLEHGCFKRTFQPFNSFAAWNFSISTYYPVETWLFEAIKHTHTHPHTHTHSFDKNYFNGKYHHVDFEGWRNRCAMDVWHLVAKMIWNLIRCDQLRFSEGSSMRILRHHRGLDWWVVWIAHVGWLNCAHLMCLPTRQDVDYVCSRCNSCFYCSEDCQRKDRAGHVWSCLVQWGVVIQLVHAGLYPGVL